MVDLPRLLERLVKGEVECVLAGGFAAMVHGVSLVTRDIDVCTHFSRENLERIHAAVSDLHPYHVMTPQKRPFEIPDGFERGLRNLYLGTDLGRVDFLGEVLGIGGYQAAFDASIGVQLDCGKIRILNRRAMITAKSAMDRPHDKIAVVELRAIEERQAPEPQ
ncbi:MAG: hypothetical protein ABI680_16100 [Chthoniobacteraceae bacterium]